ncbi:t-SNARE [Sporodiniella umbellata]|nr:t-SNARE [Sporodiniella umbellata]
MSFNDVEQGLDSSYNATLDADEDIRRYKHLIQRITQQLFHVNGSLSNIEKLVGFLGGPKDTQEIRSSLHDVTEATRDLIKNTTQDLKELSVYNQDTLAILNHKQIRQRKLEQQKLSKDFKTIVSLFQETQKKSVSRQRESVNVLDTTHQPLDHLDRPTHTQQLVHDEQVEYNELLISEREAEIEHIEQGVIELNEIFRDMSFMVNEQETGIQSIYGNVLNIAQNTKQAADELMVANRYQKNARRSMCWFLVIVISVGSLLALILLLA